MTESPQLDEIKGRSVVIVAVTYMVVTTLVFLFRGLRGNFYVFSITRALIQLLIASITYSYSQTTSYLETTVRLLAFIMMSYLVDVSLMNLFFPNTRIELVNEIHLADLDAACAHIDRDAISRMYDTERERLIRSIHTFLHGDSPFFSPDETSQANKLYYEDPNGDFWTSEINMVDAVRGGHRLPDETKFKGWYSACDKSTEKLTRLEWVKASLEMFITADNTKLRTWLTTQSFSPTTSRLPSLDVILLAHKAVFHGYGRHSHDEMNHTISYTIDDAILKEIAKAVTFDAGRKARLYPGRRVEPGPQPGQISLCFPAYEFNHIITALSQIPSTVPKESLRFGMRCDAVLRMRIMSDYLNGNCEKRTPSCGVEPGDSISMVCSQGGPFRVSGVKWKAETPTPFNVLADNLCFFGNC